MRAWHRMAALTLLTVATHPCFAAYTQPNNKPQPPAAESEALEEITVEADRATLQKSVSVFVRQVTRQMDDERALARWKDPVCPLVSGLPTQAAEFVLERISTIARNAGAPLADKDCKPNFFVMVTADRVGLLKSWSRREPNLFPDAFPTAVKRFMDSERPISIWYNDSLVGSFDQTIGVIDVGGSQKVQYPTFRSSGSRLQFNEVISISSVIVVIDVTRAQGYEIHPIADYVAMAGLMEINLDADLGHSPSVLRLFNAAVDTRPAGLSSWDEAFLKGLYGTNQALRAQRAEIADEMLQVIAPQK